MRAWLRFVRTAWLEWIDWPKVPRPEIRELCMAALVGALAGTRTDARQPRLNGLAERGPNRKGDRSNVQ